jgi:hypothetical protein
MSPQPVSWQGNILRAAIPPSRDPFVNANLVSLGPDEEGDERFWISSWNTVSGTLGALVTESGGHRIYRFGPPHSGFYSVAQQDQDTLWLCGDLAHVVRLSLSSGRFECFATGAPPALVFQGMAFDAQSGQLFAAANPGQGLVAFAFDTRLKKPAGLYQSLCEQHYMCSSFDNGDGSVSCLVYNPGLVALRWNPHEGSVKAVTLATGDPSGEGPISDTIGFSRTITDDLGRRYFPQLGWNDAASGEFSEGPTLPGNETTWFARRGDRIWGAIDKPSSCSVVCFDTTTQRLREICVIENGHSRGVNLSVAGKLMAVTLYGDLLRFDGESGALELSHRLPTDAVGGLDCLCRLDDDRLLGTPFITQRFWQVNLSTGQGFDCGRAAPLCGQIQMLAQVDGKVYLAAYGGGHLMQFDSTRHPNYPENPRVVAAPPGAMRPVAITQADNCLIYSCSHEYGKLGCILTRYQCDSGLAQYHDDPLKGQRICSLHYHAGSGTLLAGTTNSADCNSCPPSSNYCYLIELDSNTLAPKELLRAPEGTYTVAVIGNLSARSILCSVQGHFEGSDQTRLFAVTPGELSIPPLAAMYTLPAGVRSIHKTDCPGFFVLHGGPHVELWDMGEHTVALRLISDDSVVKCQVQGDSVYLTTAREIIVLDHCLPAA